MAGALEGGDPLSLARGRHLCGSLGFVGTHHPVLSL